MRDVKKIAERIEASLADEKIRKYSFKVTEKETRELTAENGEFNLLRTLFDNNVSVSVFKGGKQGLVAGNDISNKGIDALVRSAVLSADSAVKDPCHDIAPAQEGAKFRQGVLKADFDVFFDRIKELIGDIGKEYPKIQISDVIGKYIKVHSLVRNSNGVDFEDTYGLYKVSVTFAGHEGERTTGMDYGEVSLNDPGQRLIDMGSLRSHLDSAQRQLEQIPVEGKFTGTVLFTPDCFAQFVGLIISNYTSDGVLIDGTSLWKRKLGKKVASEKLTVGLDSFDDRIVVGERITDDGFRTERLPIIEKGILRNFTIGLYAAKKTKREVSRNSSNDLVVSCGDTSFAEMLKGIEKGLIVGGFSGGNPSANGDFSGVAKNAFYVENGEVKGAVSEVMINGNMGSMLMDIRAISDIQVCDGGMVVPYVAVDNIVISGK